MIDDPAAILRRTLEQLKKLPRWEGWDESPVPMHEHPDGDFLVRDDVLDVLTEATKTDRAVGGAGLSQGEGARRASSD